MKPNHLVSILLTCAAAAQGSIVSPAANATHEGNGASLWPFHRTFRYMQIHTDLKGPARAIKAMRFRRDGLLANDSQAVARTLELEVWIGEGDLGRRSATYASNYIGKRQLVMARRKVNTPDWVAKPARAPAAFDFAIVFDRPGAYSGRNDLVWEMAVWSSSQNGKRFWADSIASGRANNGPFRRLGWGCTVRGQTRPMLASALILTHRAPSRVRYFGVTRYALPNTPVAMMVGVRNPARPLPACGPGMLFTEPLVTIVGTTDATGEYDTGSDLVVPWVPSFEGTKFYTQSFVPDATQPGLKVAVSNGMETTVPPLGKAPLPFARITAEGAPAATRGTVGMGWVVVTRFDL